MAHLIKLNQLDLDHDNNRGYTPILFNLDMAVSIEPSIIHSIINTKNNGIIRVRENLNEIFDLASLQ
jgi:hypothetical protein